MRTRQDLKQTPQKLIPRSHRKRLHDESITKQLVLPFSDIFCTGYDISSTLTPLKKQPEYLMTPSPIKKDLFSQLLGTEVKHYSPLEKYEDIIEEESLSISEEEDDLSDNSMEDEGSEEQANWSEENGLKKRKRKSTTQIKLLKQQLDGEMNWTKQKIAKMAQITGLSQSQVYKWCWDQKKKQNKTRQVQQQYQKNIFQKRKMIKKDIGYRLHYQRDQDQQKENQKQFTYVHNKMTKTKTKEGLTMPDGNQTEKKVKKRLIFH